MSRRIFPVALTVATAVLAVGCADSLLPATPISVTAAEVNQLFSEIGAVFDQANLTLDKTAALGPNFDRMATISSSINCSGGGTAAFSGTEASDGTSVDVTVSFSKCMTPHWTIDGSFQATE